jgi:hypothetical protein
VRLTHLRAGNGEREIREHNLAVRTVSLWTYINSKQHKRRFKNYLYTAKCRKISAKGARAHHNPRPPAAPSDDDDDAEEEYDQRYAGGDADGNDSGAGEDEEDEGEDYDESSDERRPHTDDRGGGGEDEDGRVLFPRTSVRRLKLWDAYYMRWMADLGAHREAEEREDIIARLHDDNKRLRRRLQRYAGASKRQRP